MTVTHFEGGLNGNSFVFLPSITLGTTLKRIALSVK